MQSELQQVVRQDEAIIRMLDDCVSILIARGIRPTKLNVIAAATDRGLDQEGAEQVADAIEMRLTQLGHAM